jgi:tRNA-dihydrouridine synthase A
MEKAKLMDFESLKYNKSDIASFDRRISVAPMMAYTDRHCRYFHRLLSKNVLLYTEMVTTGALVYGDRDHYLKPDLLPGPVAYQLGGSDPKDLAKCAKWIEEAGFSEVNLNVGCPSDRVQRGCFGLSLLKTPELVFDCVAAMKDAVKNIPVTVKTRIGYDEFDQYDRLVNFISGLINSNCDHVTVHARKGWLSGLDPKQNRTIPPLKYDIVYDLKKDFPDFSIGINGGIKTIDEMSEHLKYVDEVMVGRAFYQNPFLLADLDNIFYNSNNNKLNNNKLNNNIINNKIKREAILNQMAEYCDFILSDNKLNINLRRKYKIKIAHIAKSLLGLYSGEKNGKVWRGYLGDKMHKVGDLGYLGDRGGDLLRESLSCFN